MPDSVGGKEGRREGRAGRVAERVVLNAMSAIPFSGGHSVAGWNTVVDTGSEALPDLEYIFGGRAGLTCDKRA